MEVQSMQQATLVCVFCSQLVDQSVCLSFSLLQFLSTLLPLPGPQLPAKVCAACHLGASDCHAFQQRCLRAIRKVAKTEVCPAMVLGRSEDEARQVREAFQKETKEEEGEGRRRKTDQLHLENRSLLEQASEEYGDVQLLVRKPRVSVSSGERKVAELALKGLGSRQKAEEDIIGRQNEESIWHCSVREEKVDEESEAEMFPSFGPYQCEICQAIIETKQEFVKHIKTLHRGMVDKAVLRSLELDLKKKKKKEKRNLKKPAERKKLHVIEQVQEKSSGKFKLKKKGRRKRNQHGGLSDSEDEYIPNKRTDIQLAQPKHVPNDSETLPKAPVMPKQTSNAVKLDNAEDSLASQAISTERPVTDEKHSSTKVSSLLRSFRREPPAVKEKSESRWENPGQKKSNSSHTVARLLAVDTPQYERHPLVVRRLSAVDNDTTFNYKASIAKRYEAERSVEDVKSSDLCRDADKMATIDICEDVSSSGEKETELLRSSFDRLTQEMAALHGAAGSNTPWREMHDTFFG